MIDWSSSSLVRSSQVYHVHGTTTANTTPTTTPATAAAAAAASQPSCSLLGRQAVCVVHLLLNSVEGKVQIKVKIQIAVEVLSLVR
jgi:hypothetical protein